MKKYTSDELISIANELMKQIPSSISKVNYGGVFVIPEKQRFCELIKVKLSTPRWYRHPDEYNVNQNEIMLKNIMDIEQWENKLFNVIEKIEKKYDIKVGDSL